MNRLFLAATIAALWVGVAASPLGAQSAPAWQGFDTDRNGRFDRDDVDRIMREGEQGQPAQDANRDGRKDGNDLWHMLGLLTRWDRDANGHVDAADSRPAGRLRLPAAADRQAVLSIARTVAAAHAGEAASQPLYAAAVQAVWKQQPSAADSVARAAFHDRTGLGALLMRNLEYAAWSFAQAVQLQPDRASAVSNLAFVLAELERYEDALVVSSHALALDAEACAIRANIATVFGRDRQRTEALRHYRAAAEGCPTVGQYRVNLGAALLRLDSTSAALAAFRAADRMGDVGVDAQLMIWSIDPPEIPTTVQLRTEWEAERGKAAATLASEGGDASQNPYQPWAQTSPWERATFALQSEGSRAEREFEKAQEALRAATQQQIERLLEPFLPKEPSCEQLKKISVSYPAVANEVLEIQARADQRLRELDRIYQRKSIAYRMALDPLILRLALEDGQRRLATEGRAGFNESIDQYETMMEELRAELKNVQSTTGFNPDDLDPNGHFEAVSLSLMYHVTGLVAQGIDCDAKAKSGKVNAPEAEFGVDVVVVGFSVKPKNCEFKIKAGQGVIVAGTWSPTAGFGFEYGVGMDFKFGPFSAGGAKYTRIGSDGSITDTKGGGVSAGVGPLTASASVESSTQAFAAEHAPIGASSWLASAMGCE